MDRELEQRVWSRVQGREGTSLSPEGALLDVMTDRAVAAHWAARSRGPAAEHLRLLERQLRQQMGVLRGLCRLEELASPGQAPEPEGREPVAALRKCLGRMLRRERYFGEQSRESLGPLYAALAQSTRESCLTLCRAVAAL